MLKHKDDVNLENVIRLRGISDIYTCSAAFLCGYTKGMIAEHRVFAKWLCRAAFLAAAFVVVLVVIFFVPGVLDFPKNAETIASIAQAAEEAAERDMPEESDEDTDEGLEGQKPESETEETENNQKPLDDSLMIPADVCAEKGHSAVFKAYHPQATDYRWEIYDTEAECWQKAPEEAVIISQDELYREISSLQLTADRDRSIRCQITTISGRPFTYEADLHILSGTIQSITAEDVNVQVGEYVSAMDIPIEVTYQDGSRDEITGLNGLYFLEQTETKRDSTTESGNLTETITTIRTAGEYILMEDMGLQEGLLCYRPDEEEFIDIPIIMTGIDMTPPQITSLTVDEYEVSAEDEPVPVTISIKAIDEVTPTRQLEYVFLPEGADIEAAEWKKESSFTIEITQNGVWTAYVRDESGNIASKEQNLVVVDSKAPVISLKLKNNNGWCVENQIYVSAEDALPVEYRYLCAETGEDSGWVSESSRSVNENGNWKVQVKDAVGNVTEETIMIDNIDTQAPVIRGITEKKEEGESVSDEE